MNVKLLSIVAGIFLLVASGCGLDDNKDGPLPAVAYVSLYQASPNAPGLNIILDQKVINNSDFEYADHTGYLKFVTGDRKLQFGPSGASNVVADTTMKFEENKAYSVFVVNTYEKVDLLVLNDEVTTPPSGKSRIRFLNLSPDAPKVDLQVGDTGVPVISGKGFKEVSDFVTIDASKYVFNVKSSSGDQLLTLPDVVLLDGWSYTILVRGFKTPPAGSKSVLSAEVIVD